jgi:cytochrome c-type biogenesis protein CcmF
MIPALFLMGVGPFAHWKHASFSELARTLRWAFLAAAVVGIATPFLYGEWTPLIALGLLLAAWIVLAGTLNFVQRVQSTRAGQPFLIAVLKQPRSFFGMHTAHVGIAAFVVGVTMVNGYQAEKDVKMELGDTVSVGGYTFRFNGVKPEKGPNYTALIGDVDLLKNDRLVRKMNPEKRIYVSSTMPMTEAAIDTGFLRDVYVSLGEPIDKAKPEAAWAVRVYYKPFVDWIWGGCVLMALGGLIAMSDRRYRARAPRNAPISTTKGVQSA